MDIIIKKDARCETPEKYLGKVMALDGKAEIAVSEKLDNGKHTFKCTITLRGKKPIIVEEYNTVPEVAVRAAANEAFKKYNKANDKKNDARVSRGRDGKDNRKAQAMEGYMEEEETIKR